MILCRLKFYEIDINHGSTLLERRSSHYKTLFEPSCKLENRLALYTHAGKRAHMLDEIHDLYSFMHWESSNLPLGEQISHVTSLSNELRQTDA